MTKNLVSLLPIPILSLNKGLYSNPKLISLEETKKALLINIKMILLKYRKTKETSDIVWLLNRILLLIQTNKAVIMRIHFRVKLGREASQVITMLRIGILIEEAIRKALQERSLKSQEIIVIIKDSRGLRTLIRLAKDLGIPKVEAINSPSLIHQERISKKALISKSVINNLLMMNPNLLTVIGRV